jgi:hypothetical protein
LNIDLNSALKLIETYAIYLIFFGGIVIAAIWLKKRGKHDEERPKDSKVSLRDDYSEKLILPPKDILIHEQENILQPTIREQTEHEVSSKAFIKESEVIIEQNYRGFDIAFSKLGKPRFIAYDDTGDKLAENVDFNVVKRAVDEFVSRREKESMKVSDVEISKAIKGSIDSVEIILKNSDELYQLFDGVQKVKVKFKLSSEKAEPTDKAEEVTHVEPIETEHVEEKTESVEEKEDDSWKNPPPS